jgi:regulator of RNase E activity RraA
MAADAGLVSMHWVNVAGHFLVAPFGGTQRMLSTAPVAVGEHVILESAPAPTPALPDPALLETLRRFDTPTVCNALAIVAPLRRAVGFTRRPLVCVRPELPPMVGYAATVTFRAAVPPTGSADERRARRIAYYEYVAGLPRPSVIVVQDLDDPAGFGAMWGEVNTTVHLGLGAVGVVTNGSVRDIDPFAPGFQALAGSIGPSHAYGSPAGWGEPVDVHGMTVRHGDLVHAGRHGAVVIPADTAAAIPAAVGVLVHKEKVIPDLARAPGFTIEALRAAFKASDDMH